MKRIALILAVLALVMVGQVWAANTVTTTNKITNVSAIDSDYDHGWAVIGYIMWVPGAVSDVLVIKEGSATGAISVYATAQDESTLLIPVNGYMSPYLDFSECTLSAGSMLIIQER